MALSHGIGGGQVQDKNHEEKDAGAKGGAGAQSSSYSLWKDMGLIRGLEAGERHDQTPSDSCIRKIPVDSKLEQNIQVETDCKVKGRRRQPSTSSER